MENLKKKISGIIERSTEKWRNRKTRKKRAQSATDIVTKNVFKERVFLCEKNWDIQWIIIE